MKQTEGTWDATIRKIVWGVPIAAVVIGLLLLSFAYLQPSYTATVTEVGETAYTRQGRWSEVIRAHTMRWN